jgi:hypothetical protein
MAGFRRPSPRTLAILGVLLVVLIVGYMAIAGHR